MNVNKWYNAINLSKLFTKCYINSVNFCLALNNKVSNN